VIERTNAWHGRYRRHSKDYERTLASNTAMIHVRHLHLMLNRLSPSDRPAFHYRPAAAWSWGNRVHRFPDSLSRPGEAQHPEKRAHASDTTRTPQAAGRQDDLLFALHWDARYRHWAFVNRY